MSKQKLKLLATPDKTRPEKPLVQLTEAQLEACSGGAKQDDGCPPWNCGGNHNETMVSAAQLNLEEGKPCRAPKLKLLATAEKTLPEKPLVELTEDQLEAYAGGGRVELTEAQLEAYAGGVDHGGCVPPICAGNHNETMVSRAQLNG